MTPGRRAAALALACALLAATGCGDDEPAATTGTRPSETGPSGVGAPPPPPSGAVTEPAEPGPPESDAERTAVAAASSYVEAISARDAAEVCSLLAPGAERGLRGTSGPCTAAMAKAIGRPARGGAPAWQRTEIEHPVSVVVSSGRARVTLEVFHHFSDRRNPSVEDEVIFLELRGGSWLVSKPSATLYRAVGYPEPPLDAYRAPG